MMGGVGQHTAFFVALNRCTTIISIGKKAVNVIIRNQEHFFSQSDAVFFYASIIISILLSSLKIVNLLVFTKQYYIETDFGAGSIFIPRIDVYSEVRYIFSF